VFEIAEVFCAASRPFVLPEMAKTDEVHRYSIFPEASNLKKSLKSGGSRIVAIIDGSHQFHGGKPFTGCPRSPIRAIVRRFEERRNGNH